MYKIRKRDLSSISMGKSIPVGKSDPQMKIKILKGKKEIKK